MTAADIYDEVFQAMRPIHGKDEAAAIARQLVQHVMGWPPGSPVRDADAKAAPAQAALAGTMLKRLKTFEPLQHVMGHTWFYGLRLQVNAHVLIPRPETEELVHAVLASLPQDYTGRVLDLGTGSGCIAIALASRRPGATVHATDISGDALDVARDNALQNGVCVKFSRTDMLREPPAGTFDIIVSNPPYISSQEKGNVSRHVSGAEPHLALFVPGRNPVLFYERICSMASGDSLAPGGHLFLEINPVHASGLKDMLESSAFGQVKLMKDMSGHDRILHAVKK